MCMGEGMEAGAGVEEASDTVAEVEEGGVVAPPSQPTPLRLAVNWVAGVPVSWGAGRLPP